MSEDPTLSDEKQLERLILQLVSSPYDPRNHNSRLFIGKLPENFPIDVPIPEKTRVVCTLVRSEQSIQIVLESNLVRDEVVAFYRTQLTNRDWIEPGDTPPHPMMGGFSSSGIPSPQKRLAFCQGEQGPSLFITTSSDGATTDLNLSVQLNKEVNPLYQQKLIQQNSIPGFRAIIPVLTPPAGSQQYMMNGIGGSGQHDRNSGATLQSDLALDVLAKHYGEQLSKAGWIQSDEGVSAPAAWHTWKFTSGDQEPWKGIFFLIKRPDKKQEHILFVRVELDRSKRENPFSGWLGSVSKG